MAALRIGNNTKLTTLFSGCNRYGNLSYVIAGNITIGPPFKSAVAASEYECEPFSRNPTLILVLSSVLEEEAFRQEFRSSKNKTRIWFPVLF
ncbi:hypothetical protein DAPPUDRAFT_312527 [Daphnia pulex]|uniref:Uncharacterized protein n=1 Tax=Daphnia pulex TaxID=6669 RepID=E9FZC3_DAPPU|nr:hypothetical protein DAPPUDRAFT_312527 [Daphnia pulex]|eukprot:EFX87026.1 hypothetical protein DAPPUDRAFT_312527 [Daphnia pulex]